MITKRYHAIGEWQQYDYDMAMMELAIFHPTLAIWAILDEGLTLSTPYADYKLVK